MRSSHFNFLDIVFCLNVFNTRGRPLSGEDDVGCGGRNEDDTAFVSDLTDCRTRSDHDLGGGGIVGSGSAAGSSFFSPFTGDDCSTSFDLRRCFFLRGNGLDGSEYHGS